ncbi:MAG: division plane positioning ATPase MipZ, partial [Bauldia sp.]
NTYLMRVSHAMADTLITPINDSFVDFDVLAHVDANTFEIVETSHYADLVGEARRQRMLVDERTTDWVVVRNRLAPLGTRNRRQIETCLKQLAPRIGFRVATGIAERVVFRELFPRGLTALDELNQRLLGGEPTLSHLAARDEIRSLVDGLRLPAPKPAASEDRAEDAAAAAGARSAAEARAQLRRAG